MSKPTVAELRAALPGAPAEFILGQLEAGADVPTARAAWLDERERQLVAREKAAKPSGSMGVPPIGCGRPARESESEGGAEEFARMVDELVAKGKTRIEAVAAVGRKHPDLHHAFVCASNPGKTRVQALIDERFGL